MSHKNETDEGKIPNGERSERAPGGVKGVKETYQDNYLPHGGGSRIIWVRRVGGKAGSAFVLYF